MNFIQELIPNSDRIQLLTANQKIQHYRLRNQFFINLFNQKAPNGFNPNVLNNEADCLTLVGMNEINQNVEYFRAKVIARQNPQTPSLFKFRFYFLPILLFHEQNYNQINNQFIGANESRENVLHSLEIFNPNLLRDNFNQNQIKVVNQIPQNQQFAPDFQFFAKYNINATVDTIMNFLINGRSSKIIFNLEILYSDLDYVEFANLQNNQDQRLKLIRYQRAFAIIDKQIMDNKEQKFQIEQANFEYQQNNQFRLRNDNPNINDDIIWKKINYNYTFELLGNQVIVPQIPPNIRQFYIVQDIPPNQQHFNQQKDYVIDCIFNNITNIDGVYDAQFPTFFRYMDIYAIKEWEINNINFPQQAGVPVRQQPQILNDNLEIQLQDFLNGMIVFDYDQNNIINQYDIIDNNIITKQQHCLLRILYYFDKQQNNNLNKDEWLLNIIEQQNQLNNNQDFEKYPFYGIFMGSARHLIKYIKQKYDILINVYCYQSTRELEVSQSQYYIIINKNHCILSNRLKIAPLKVKKNENQYYSMLSKTSQNKQLNSKKNKKYHEKQNKRKDMLIKNIYIDFETFISDPVIGKQEVFLICIIDDENNKTHFIELQCLDQFINYIEKLYLESIELEMIYNIWTFNGGKFDFMFIVPKLLEKFNEQIFIIGTEIDIKQINIGENLYFKDIYLIFNNGSLKQQAKNWGLPEQKQDFDINGWTLDQYRDQQKQQKVIEYCYQDCLVLKYIVEKFFELINNEFQNNKFNTNKVKYDITKIFSASTLTMNIFKDFYLNHDIQSSKNREIYQIERNSYFGGITMNFKKQGTNLFYYDINSSYPNVMKHNLIPIRPINSNNEKIFQPQEINGLILDNGLYNLNMINQYDLYEIDLIYKDDIIIPCLPVKTKDGLIYLKEVIKSWRWGCEIQFLNDWGLIKEIKIHRIIKYFAQNVFKEFIDDLYLKRQEGKRQKRSDLDQFYKILMNSLYGKFGQKQYPFTKYVQNQQLEENLRDPLIQDIKEINQNITKLQIARKNNLNFQGALVRIASFITAKARINLMEGIQQVGQQNVYYCDTDSITTSKQLPDHMIGDKLGQWKLECQIKEGIFIAPKIYYIKLEQPDEKGKIELKKCKGINQRSLNNEIFNQLKQFNISEAINKNVFQREFGFVNIKDQKKIIRIKDLKRIWLNDETSIPYNNLFQYEQDKLIKDEINEEYLYKNQLLKKLMNTTEIKQKMIKKYQKQYQKVINDDSEVNQKRKQQYLETDEYNFIQNKIQIV